MTAAVAVMVVRRGRSGRRGRIVRRVAAASATRSVRARTNVCRVGSSLGTRQMADHGRPEPFLTRHLRGWPLDELFEAGEAVEHLLAHPGWAHVDRLLGAEIATIEASLDGGLLESKAAYAFAHGRKGGLKAAREAAGAIVHKAAVKLEEQRSRHERDAGSSREE